MTYTERYQGIIHRYRDRLPVSPTTKIISLGEGNTPLIKLDNLTKKLGVDLDIYVKYEGLNPTGSFKDRGMTMAVTKAVEEGSQAIICASTGNTSAAAAAYAARAGIRAFVLIPQGKIALGKLAQAMLHGAIVVQIAGNFDLGMRLVKEVSGQAPVTIVNSVNPFRLQGQKTASFEVIEALGRAPDYHALPVGNAGNITAHWLGYCEYSATSGENLTEACAFCQGQCRFAGGFISSRQVSNRPKMLGYQAAGSAPFVVGAMVDQPETIGTAIRIGHPQSWDYAWKVRAESGGWFAACTDEKMLETQKLLASLEGIFCEPASAVSLAGVLADYQAGKILPGKTVVCTLTGHGLKDPDTAIKQSGTVLTVPAHLDAVRKVILDYQG